MNKETSNAVRIIVGAIFLILGAIGAVRGVVGIFEGMFEFHSIISFAVNLIMFLSGLLAIMRVRKTVCILFTVILFVGFAVNCIFGVIENAPFWDVVFSAVEAFVSVLFIFSVDLTSTNKKSIRKK